jgi:predicted nucleic acid-binding protein
MAAQLQGQLRMKLFDEIHVAAARLAGCENFLTEDERLGRALAGEPKWLRLSDVH